MKKMDLGDGVSGPFFGPLTPSPRSITKKIGVAQFIIIGYSV